MNSSRARKLSRVAALSGLPSKTRETCIVIFFPFFTKSARRGAHSIYKKLSAVAVRRLRSGSISALGGGSYLVTVTKFGTGARDGASV